MNAALEEDRHLVFKVSSGKGKVGLLTFEVHAGLSTQPLEERPHHLCTAEALEAGADVLVVPLQSADLQDSVQKKQEVVGTQVVRLRVQQFRLTACSFPHQATGVGGTQTLSAQLCF